MKDIYVVLVEYWHGNTLISTKNSQVCYSTYESAREFVDTRGNVKQINPWLFKDSKGIVYKIDLLSLMEVVQ